MNEEERIMEINWNQKQTEINEINLARVEKNEGKVGNEWEEMNRNPLEQEGVAERNELKVVGEGTAEWQAVQI